MLAWLSPIWTISCFDSCVHMSEEATNAAKAVPYGILMATGSTWILGFIVLVVIAAVINPDLAGVYGTALGQPMAQIYEDALGKNGALGFMSLLLICQFLMGLSIVCPPFSACYASAYLPTSRWWLHHARAGHSVATEHCHSAASSESSPSSSATLSRSGRSVAVLD